VSRDKDLLDLMFDPDFRSNHLRLIILDPVAFLHVVADPAAGDLKIAPGDAPDTT
jgi:hypothetical protein